jgi:hypothetical protein
MSDNHGMRRVIAGVPAVLLLSCGGYGSSPTPNPGGTPVGPTITLTASGLSAGEVTVSPGARVTFVNNDARPHNMTSDPHPEHDEEGCEGINAVGVLQPGQRRETGNMVIAKTCGFHDHDDPPPAGARWVGRITVR